MTDVSRIRAACARLRATGRGAAWSGRSWSQIADTLGRVGARFLDPADPIRIEALERLPTEADLSPEMSRAVLEGMAADWTPRRLQRLVAEEFAEPGCLDGFLVAGEREVMARGPELCVQIVSGSVPGVGVNALIRSLLVKGPTLIKPGRGDVALTDLFARGVREADPELGAAVEVIYWPGDDEDLTREALASADLAVVYGSDRTVAEVRALAAPTTRVIGYHHRIGVGVVGREALSPDSVGRVAEDAAKAVAMFEQRGCVCPHVLYVEEGGQMDAREFAEVLADALRSLAWSLPSPPLPPDEGAAIQQLRGTAELGAATGEALVRHGGAEAPWTVVYEKRPLEGGPVTLGRGVRVRGIRDADDLAEALAPDGAHLQSVAYAGLGDRLTEVAEALGRVGASRVVPFHRVSFPPAWWLHDGRGPLRELVRWVEVER
jgi:hypothetical protein